MPSGWSIAEKKRPRVAAIGLNDSQLAEIRPFCGDLRPAQSVYAYLADFEWWETDVVVASGLYQAEIDPGVHLLTVGPMSLGVWQGTGSRPDQHFRELVRMDTRSRARELAVAYQCPPTYRNLAETLAKALGSVQKPPPTITVSEAGELLRQPVVLTSGDHPVALRLQWADRDWGHPSEITGVDVVALYLPFLSNLSDWFRAFLADISEFDPARVPQDLPLFGDSSDWYTPEETAFARQILEIEQEIERLNDDRTRAKAQLARAGKTADATVRRAITEYGEELVDAVSEILGEIGFIVERMDDAIKPNEARREDLRLTLTGRPDWEAIVEVKGYAKGIKTIDASKVRMHRDRYIADARRHPDLTMWLVNPFREMDPSVRPAPDQHVDQAAKIVGAACVLTTDLYQQWKLFKEGQCEASEIVQRLVGAEPGLWRPSLAG